MTARKTAQLRAALEAKGFRRVDTHHELYWLWAGERKTSISTKISHSAREYGDPLLSEMSRQIGLKRSEFDDLVDCPLSADGYLTLLTERGKVRL